MTTKPTKRVRCAVYTRVSTEYGLDQEFNSLDAQHEAAEAYIRSQAQSSPWEFRVLAEVPTFPRVRGQGARTRSFARNFGRLAPKTEISGARLCSTNFQYPKFWERKVRDRTKESLAWELVFFIVLGF
jgi:hypothetical protein